MKTPILLMTSLLFILTSCEKDKDKVVDKEDILVSGAWQITALTVDPAIDWFGTEVNNVYAQLPPCVKDNLTVFKSNGTVNYDEGASKCDPNEPQTTSGTWAFNLDKTVISMTQDGETESWNISQINENIIKAEYQITEDGITYTFSIQLAKK